RVGVYAVDTVSQQTVAHRADERFAMCSTFKWALAAAVLEKVDRGEESLSEMVRYTEADLLEYAPVTRGHLAEGQLTVEALCEAAVTLSDNTAANLLLDRVGGPAGLTAFFRQHGDDATRLDRDEPTLNTNLEGDPRDTTTPRAMATTLNELVLGSALKEESRGRLVGWLRGCKTCDQRLWAGLPDGWTAGTKTGTCLRGGCNDVGLVWPPDREPIVVAAYLSDSDATLPERSAVLASVGRIVAARFG
ncbi:MAG: class A beta-lactamase, partial [Polyangiaceae bacterium]